MNPPDTFNAMLAEQAELNTLIERGVQFTVQKRSLLKWLGKPERTFELKQPFLFTLDQLSAEFVLMDFSEDRLKQNPLGESKVLAHINAKRCARIVAIAVLNRRWKIRFLGPLLAYYLADRLTPTKLFQLVILINQISNLGDFTNSIRFLHASRTTAPALIETPELDED
ncbi:MULTISPECIES: hypothetical protein [unclassified Spirosoma]|uniref:hypothetical protein n=1 Tax=unclassified Spirosoma TaxID=2621999 RepID=UPI00095FE8D7|nr:MULTISPECIES: hypothetical protein [unclassified Spirosoma]MBN8820759.1 hypothetical protein [Spirosoma sp.]OJW78057.1 MAG: hypothetical protein BGO59_28995 [Spirosoma sp. 48-14]